MLPLGGDRAADFQARFKVPPGQNCKRIIDYHWCTTRSFGPNSVGLCDPFDTFGQSARYLYISAAELTVKFNVNIVAFHTDQVAHEFDCED